MSQGGGDQARQALPRRNTRKVSHLLAGDLRREILSGRLAADEQLPPEAELTARYGVSRETLREALRILESQSLLEIRRGRNGGAVVRSAGLEAVGRYVALLLQLRNTTLADLEEARCVVEPPAAEQVAIRAGYDELDRLVARHDAERAVESDPFLFATEVATFDQAVMELSGNRTLAVFAGVFRDIYAGQVYSAIGSSPDRASADRMARRVIVSHSAFLDAARRRDGSLARKTWNDYLYTTARMIVSRNRSRETMDVTPLWRARAGRAGGDRSHRGMAFATEIRARIAEGRLRDGDRLPSVAGLATEFGISRPTLREGLRILEMEFLLDLRTGDRGGATIRTPTTQVAAQLAGIVLEARQTTFGDFSRAARLIQPSVLELVATRIGPKARRTLRGYEQDLAGSVEDTARFLLKWRDAQAVAFAEVRNPALTVIAEIFQWGRVNVEPALTEEADNLPWVAKTNRNAHGLFSQFVDAAEQDDSARARDVWAVLLNVNAPFLEDSKFSRRLMIDLID